MDHLVLERDIVSGVKKTFGDDETALTRRHHQRRHTSVLKSRSSHPVDGFLADIFAVIFVNAENYQVYM